MAKCKHENADHVGPDERFTAWSWVEHFICIDCGTWLSLGASNDSPEVVRVEIEAARLAADGIDTGDLRSARGWVAHYSDSGPPPLPPESRRLWHAGHLAACIATEGT